MKNQVKNFGQFINENDRLDFTDNRESVGIVDLLGCYVRENYANDQVLITFAVDSSASDLVDGGIRFTVNPTERELGEAEYDGTVYAELYENGERVIEE